MAIITQLTCILIISMSFAITSGMMANGSSSSCNEYYSKLVHMDDVKNLVDKNVPNKNNIKNTLIVSGDQFFKDSSVTINVGDNHVLPQLINKENVKI